MSRLSCLLSTLTRFSVHSQLTVLNYSVFPPKLPFRLGSTASLLPSDVLLWAPQQSPPLQESRQAPGWVLLSRPDSPTSLVRAPGETQRGATSWPGEHLGQQLRLQGKRRAMGGKSQGDWNDSHGPVGLRWARMKSRCLRAHGARVPALPLPSHLKSCPPTAPESCPGCPSP